MHGAVRIVALVVAALLALVVIAQPADARPRISSFYAKDEGSRIHLKVNFCDFTGEVDDSYSATFRMWDENDVYSVKLLQRRVSGRIYDECGYASMRIPDTFYSGLYSANVAVTNRTTGAFTRIAARYFRIR